MPVQEGSGVKFYRPRICTTTGYWGGGFCCVAPSVAAAFKMLQRRIDAGKVQWRPYAKR